MKTARHLLALALAVGACVSLVGAASSSTPAHTWSGTWDSSWGEMKLVQTGLHVVGTYTHDQGHIAGTVSGSVLTARWDEAPTRKGPSDAGPVELTMKPDGKSFSGRWAYDGSPTSWSTNWDGTCTAGACMQASDVRFSFKTYANDVRVGPPLVGAWQLGVSRMDGSGVISADGKLVSGGSVSNTFRPNRYTWHPYPGTFAYRVTGGTVTLTPVPRLVLDVVLTRASSPAPKFTCRSGMRGTITLVDNDAKLANGQSADTATVQVPACGHSQGWGNIDDPNTQPPRGGPGGGKWAVVEITPVSVG